MKNKRIILLFVFVLLLLVSCNRSKVTVFSDGESDFSIILSDDASYEEKSLANSLVEMSGSGLTLRSDTEAETKNEIVIGNTARGAVESYLEELCSLASVSYFHFLIAEVDCKIYIIADSEVGYLYAGDYLASNYLKDGTLTVPKKCKVIEKVSWDVYYASEKYEDYLIMQKDQNRYEEEQKHLENEMNRYEGDKDNSIMTVEQVIEQYKKMAASFSTASFGEYSSTSFTAANTYAAPTVYPGESHPRVMFTENSIEKVRENFTAAEMAPAYARYMRLSDLPCDGSFKPITDGMAHNMDYNVAANIEAKAFRYAMTGEELYGYQAIYAIKNAILTLNVPHTVGDWCRAYGHVMYVAACVYDWCYDLLTENDKTQLVNGVVNLLGMHLEIVCYVSSSNKAPTAQGTVYGHGAEAQLLVEYLSFAIACYDEAPEIYELVAGRILNDYTESQNFFYSSKSHWEGAFYGAYRLISTLQSNLLFNRMTDGEVTPFTDDIEEVVLTLMHYIRPDGQTVRIGDLNQNSEVYEPVRTNIATFYAGNFYKNSTIKNFAYQGLKNFGYIAQGGAGLSAVQYLIANDPSVSHEDEEGLPLTRLTNYPLTSLFARSARNDTNAFMIYMTMPEYYGASHAHAECGSFQIFYKGALASDSGKYASWGSLHHIGYSMQTVASNSILVYNPNLEDSVNIFRKNMVYTGGQSVTTERAYIDETLDMINKNPGANQCYSLGAANVEENGKYRYSYLAGDMTKAYDAETVDEVSRYMFAVATDDPTMPLIFVTFDRITSDDASYRKSALIHMTEEPTITDDGFLIITNTKGTNNGKLIVQTLTETEYRAIGGEGKEFWLSDKLGNADTDISDAATSFAEYGWGRVEISPKGENLTDHILTVMYVTDATNKAAPIKASDISSENLAGTQLLGKAILFPKNDKLIDSEQSFTLSSSADCFITGIKAGTWEIYDGNNHIKTITVADGENILTFSATAGSYTIKTAD